jgi:hypothetical protein
MKITGVLLFLFLVAAFTYAQTPPEPQAQVCILFDSFHTSLDDLTKRFGNKSSEAIQADIARSLDNIASNVKFLEAVMSLGKPNPREYLEGLSLDAELLKKLARQRSKTAAQLKSLSDGLKEVDSDLALKVTGPRGGGEVVRVVEVFVRAKKGAEDVGAYQVWYVTKGWANDASHFKPFDRLTDPSNPSSMKLAPGNYFIWLSKGKPVTDRQPASIGMNGEARREIEVPVP